ncbi:MAG: hypothetical protein M3R53_04675 [Candidatus Eremiobacteraeota bacterium]|nr:hypothetical protein [Candidatus Eremiobacteraeota bacterium]
MSQHPVTKSPPAQTYTAKGPLRGHTLTCARCKRVYAFPNVDGLAIHCECGWRYENRGGIIEEAFKPRIGV